MKVGQIKYGTNLKLLKINVHFMVRHRGTEDRCLSVMSGAALKWVRMGLKLEKSGIFWPQMRQIQDFFRSDFRTFWISEGQISVHWLAEPKCMEI